MKSSIKIMDMKNNEDMSTIKKVIASQEGVVACEINKSLKLVNIVYDDRFLNLDNIISSIEDLGYIVL
ncbi:heavy-metal-associated domain-containing protein [Clostridium tarantellae]|uniref:Ferredoxin n=1 Tax=Clostridium tarantellae TaxID=39493 RepID=A0A6I1MG54_9CLOT|nr:heavy-metal-associated domain-containing protein [Clostridium tarantellae]MPQ42345.1 ferredoxin [Clostridium tarantellae]